MEKVRAQTNGVAFYLDNATKRSITRGSLHYNATPLESDRKHARNRNWRNPSMVFTARKNNKQMPLKKRTTSRCDETSVRKESAAVSPSHLARIMKERSLVRSRAGSTRNPRRS